VSHIRVGRVPKSQKKRLPFQKRQGRIELVARKNVNVDYGISYDRQRGHRVFFNYADTPMFKNTWGPKSLRDWANNIDTSLDEHRVWRVICLQQCDLADDMNRRWEAAGRPSQGVPEPKGTLQ